MVAETVEVSNEAACSALLALLSEYSLSSSSSSLSSASVYALEAGGHALGKLVVPASVVVHHLVQRRARACASFSP